ncbi:MAG TPA: hypothetical protein VMD97_14130 [Candidatus Aquilonibacter sp.]|nr:hypothetical protein [Candidatus Aquilonibacter sp.]
MPRAALALILLAATAATSGAQWTLQDAHTTADLRGIDNVGHGVAWASGSEGTILRTLDSGRHWQLCAKPPNADHLDFRAVQAFDNNTALIMSSGKGDLSRLYKTTDGCQTWTLLFTNPDKDGFWDALQFERKSEPPTNRVAHPSTQSKGGVSRVVARDADHNFGVLLGDPVDGHFAIFLTFDGGATWKRDPMQVKATQDEGVFAASNSSLIVSSLGDRAFCTGGPSGARVVHHNTGIEDTTGPNVFHDPKTGWATSLWFEQLASTQKTESSGCFSIAEHNGVRVAVGGDYKHPDQSSSTAWTSELLPRKSDDALRTALAPPHGYRSAVAYDSKFNTWITVGPNGTDISTDDGRNWRALHPDPKYNEASDADQHWNALSLPYVVGPHGRIGTLRPSALQTAHP